MSHASPGCVRLSRLGLLRVAGEDARTFLQGQLTADLRRVLREWLVPQRVRRRDR